MLHARGFLVQMNLPILNILEYGDIHQTTGDLNGEIRRTYQGLLLSFQGG